MSDANEVNSPYDEDEDGYKDWLNREAVRRVAEEARPRDEPSPDRPAALRKLERK